MLKRILASAALFFGLLVPALAQVPPPVPALPGTARVTTYSVTSSTCVCAVGFQLYGDGTAVDNWIQVWIGTTEYLSTDPSYGWSLSSPTGPLSTIARPITDAVLTFNAPQTGTVYIVGARSPQRLNQFSENQGVSARQLNQAITDLTAMQREVWDLRARSFLTPPGVPGAIIQNVVVIPPGNITVPPTTVVGDLATWATTNGSSLADTTMAVAMNNLCAVAGAFPLYQTSGAAPNTWQCSTVPGVNGQGVVFGAAALNTNQANTWIQNSTITGNFVSAVMHSPLDWRWQFTGPAPTGSDLVGANIYVDYEPSTSVDNHGAIAAGLNVTFHSTSPGTLAMTAGGNFTLIRHSGGSGNPYVGVIGTAVLGVPGDSAHSVGDGVAGGVFTAQPVFTETGNFLFDQGVQGVMGVLGRAVSYASPQNNIASALDMGGTIGYVDLNNGTVERAYGGFFQIGPGCCGSMALANNAYGIYVNGISGAQNVNAALRTTTGTVIFGGNEVLFANVIGSFRMLAPSKPTITLVQSGANYEFTAAAGGSYTPGGTKTYTYQIIANIAGGTRTSPSPAVSTTTGFDDLSVGGHNNYLTWNAVEGAFNYSVYRTVAGGATTTTTGLIGTVNFDTYAGQASTPSGFALRPTANGVAFVDSGQTGDGSSPATPGFNAVLQIDDVPAVDGGRGPGGGSLKVTQIFGTSVLDMGVNGGLQWRINGTGDFYTDVDNAYNIGNFGGPNRPKNIYAGTGLFVAQFTIAGLPACGASTDGMLAEITNGIASPTYQQAVSATGTTHNLVWCNGTGWAYH